MMMQALERSLMAQTESESPVLRVISKQVQRGIGPLPEPGVAPHLATRVRVYECPDGALAITIPAWNDGLSPFGPRLGRVRLWYEYAHLMAVHTLRQENIRLLPELVKLRTEALRRNLRYTFAPWTELFPFDPFTVSEEQFYEWACRNATGYGRWEPRTMIPPRYRNGVIEPAYRTVDDRFYEAMTNGVTGYVEPTHADGAVSDGGVIWQYRGTGTLNGDCDVGDLPPSREYRNQWRCLGGQVKVDPLLEADERWGRLLLERDRLLKESSEMLLEAMETGEGVAAVKAYRRALRKIERTDDVLSRVAWPSLPRQLEDQT